MDQRKVAEALEKNGQRQGGKEGISVLVTKIVQQKKDESKVNIYIDGAFAFALLKSDAAYFKLGEGKEVAEDTYRYLCDTLMYHKAQDAAIHYVGYKARTEQEVRKKLLEKEFSLEVSERVIAFLKQYGYVDDRAYCDAYIRESIRLKPKGRYLLLQELLRRGVEKETALSALSDAEWNEAEQAAALLRKKIRDFSNISDAQRRRATAFLTRKGYSYNTVKEAFSLLREEDSFF